MRLRLGLSQAQLAELASLSSAAISALEQGQRRRPHPDTLRRLANALGLSEAELESLFILTDVSADEQPSPAAVAVRPPSAAPSAGGARGFLPASPAPLIGRDADVRAIAGWLVAPEPARLVTLLGPGGVGKTRVAIAVAAALQAHFIDGAAFVDLAPVRDERLVAATAAWSLGLHEAGGYSARELLVAHLRERQTLLLFDNFEHLLGATSLLTELLAACPGVRLLVTSRSALQLRSERRVVLQPLETPGLDRHLSLEAIASSPAVQLLVDRAQAVTLDFQLTHSNAADVAAVCRRLEGVPLALELAAAGLSLLEPGALLERLEYRLALPGSGPSDLPDRQRSLRATLAWSHGLLRPAEQVLFRRLALFAGWTLAAAEAVCADALLAPGDVFTSMQALLNQSLITARRAPEKVDEPRFGMLETIREYAAEQLDASAERDVVGARHCDWYLRLAERAQPELYSPDRVIAFDRDQDNVRIALRWAIRRGETLVALRLGVICWRLWYRLGRYAEGRAWLTDILALPNVNSRPDLFAQALAYAGHLAYCQGDWIVALADLRASLRQAQSIDDAAGIERASVFLGHALRLSGDLVEAERQYTYALSLSRPEDHHNVRLAALRALARTRYERGDSAGAAAALNAAQPSTDTLEYPRMRAARAAALRGRLAMLDGNAREAWMLLEHSLAVLDESQDRQGLVLVQQLAADTALDGGDRRRGALHLAHLLTLVKQTGERPALARAFEAVAELLADADPARALALVGAAAAVRDTTAIQVTPRERSRLGAWAPVVTDAIGQAAAERALAIGRASPIQDTLTNALNVCLDLANA